MTRRGALQALLTAALAAIGCRSALRAPPGTARAASSGPGDSSDDPALPQGSERLELADATWREVLDAPAYAVLRQEATEPPGSSALDEEKRPGTFLCAGCLLPLFRSEQKFDSGTGWPSFFDAIAGRIGTQRDQRLLTVRTEYHCIRCHGHQGHVFDDGPQPTGLRYCNNGVALRFVPEAEELPPLRQRS